MHSGPLRGHSLSEDTPNWKPLLDLAPEHIEDLMWMFLIGCEDGTRIHAYKHCWTRRYLHLSEDGRAFAWRSAGRYREIDRFRLLDLVLP